MLPIADWSGRRLPPRRLRTVIAVVGASIVLVACVFGFVATRPHRPPLALATASPTIYRSPTASPTPGLPGNDWTQYRYDLAGTGANPEDLLTPTVASHLAIRWVAGGMFGGHAFESTPAVYQGTVYITDGDSLYALDLRTGRYRWQFDVTPATSLPQISSSVAIDPSTNLAYFGTPDARVVAVNLLTHQQVWQVSLGNASQGAYIWSSPLLVNSLVYIGVASHDDHPCVRGAAFALDPATGHTVWDHAMVSAPFLGGGVWSSMTADPDEDAVLVTTGNPCDGPEDVGVEGGITRQDENAILALNWNTGATLWRYTAVANDIGQDLDFGEGAVVFTENGRPYIVAGNKQGTVYALTPPGAAGGTPHLAWSTTIAVSGAVPSGGVFTPPTYHNGIIYEAGGPTPDGSCSQGALFALSATTGAVLWQHCTAGQVVSPPSESGGVLFVGEHQEVVAYNATTGAVLWQNALNGDVYGGVTVSHGFVLLGTVTGASRIYSFALPATPSA